MIPWLSLVWLLRHVVSGGLVVGDCGGDGLAALADRTAGGGEPALALGRGRLGGLRVRAARLPQRLDHLGVEAAVGRADALALERPGGLRVRGAQGAGRRALRLRRLGRLELGEALLVGRAEGLQRLAGGRGVRLARAQRERSARAEL